MTEDDQTMDRYKDAGKDYKESVEGKDSKSSKDGKDDGGIKDERESFQAYVPADDKEQIEAVWRKVKALFSLSGRDEPAKNDFYAALLRCGYNDLAGIAEQLDIGEAYDEYSDMVE